MFDDLVLGIGPVGFYLTVMFLCSGLAMLVINCGSCCVSQDGYRRAGKLVFVRVKGLEIFFLFFILGNLVNPL